VSTTENKPVQKKMLRLTIEVPQFHADDLDDCAKWVSEPDPPDADDRLYVVTEEWMRAEVVLTVCTIPGEKCTNDDFEMVPFHGRIVAADVVDRGNRGI
jgi:hypothetical protein